MCRQQSGGEQQTNVRLGQSEAHEVEDKDNDSPPYAKSLIDRVAKSSHPSDVRSRSVAGIQPLAEAINRRCTAEGAAACSSIASLSAGPVPR